MENEARYPQRRSYLQHAKDTLLAPIRIATSPTLLRTYLRTALILLTSTILFGIAVVAYTSFYYAYIPVRGIEVPIYLQYPHTAAHAESDRATDGLLSGLTPTKPSSRFPNGIANVKGLVSRQKYDVVVEMELPRSERNLLAGNWMVGVEMRSPGTTGDMKGVLGWDEEWDVGDYLKDVAADLAGDKGQKAGEEDARATASGKPVVLARSRRPALLTYRSWVTELAHKMLRLPLYVLDLRHETEVVKIPAMEAVEFEKGWRNVPASVKLEVRSRVPLEVRRVSVRFIARLEGLRWVMYTHRLTSFIVFTSLFWGVEMSVGVVTWGLFTLLFSGSEGNATSDVEERKQKDPSVPAHSARPSSKERKKKIKQDPEDTDAEQDPDNLSDTSRTFPTLSSHKPLHYSAPPKKTKDEVEESVSPRSNAPVKTEADADDEDEGADFIGEQIPESGARGGLTDSGIGTSMESSIEGRGVRRRGSEKKPEDGT